MNNTPSVLYIGDAIGCNVDFNTLEKVVGAKIEVKKAFSAVTDIAENEAKQRTKVPDKQFPKVLNQHLSRKHTDILIVQTGSVDITNLKTGERDAERFSDYFRQHTIKSAENVFDEVSH